MFFAQAVAAAILAQTGTADAVPVWLNVLLNGGAFGLLVYIVAILAPRGLQEQRQERERRDVTFASIVDSLNIKFEGRNAMLAQAIERQTERLSGEMREQTERLGRILKDRP